MKGKLKFFSALICLLLLTVTAYAPGLSGSFLFDDFPNIVDNPAVHVERLSFDQLRGATNSYESRFSNRPIATLSLGLDYYFHGLNAAGYKLTNLFLHLINLTLLVFLARSLLDMDYSYARKNHNQWPAWVALALALIWAIHPLQVSTVLYSVQRMEIMALTFVAAALLLYIAGRQRQIRGASGGISLLMLSTVSAALGFLSKETAALFPLYALAFELFYFRFRANRLREQALIRLAYIVFLALALAGFLLLLPTYLSPEAYAHRHFSLLERLLTQLRVLPFYLSLILLPAPDRMLFFYDGYEVSKRLISPVTTLLGGIFISLVLVLAFALRRAVPLASLGIIWFFAAHFLTSNIFSLELVFEHRNYFAVFPVLLVIAALVRSIPNVKTSVSPVIMIGVLVAGLATITAIRSATWGDRFNLAMYHAAINPKSERAHTELGVIYGAMSNLDPESIFYTSAVMRLERAAQIDNASPLPEQALIVLAVISQGEVKETWWASFLDKLARRPIGAQERAAVQKLLENRTSGLPIPDAGLIAAFETLLTRDAVSATLLANFGFYSLSVLNDETMAIRAFGAAMQSPSVKDENVRAWCDELSRGGYPNIASMLGCKLHPTDGRL